MFQRLAKRSERGSMIILAVGFLAVLAVAAAAYIAVARLDRASASAYARSTSFETQVNVVVDHIGALLAADLYGGKVVRSDTPRMMLINGRQTLVWPRPFEDGEFSDYPRTAFLWDDGSNDVTFDTAKPNDTEPANEARLSHLGVDEFIDDPAGLALRRFAPVPADDCWLASSEPINARPNGRSRAGGPDAEGLWDTWPQITNLRCGWELRDPDGPRGSDDPTWIRGDGLFADLGQWVIQNLDGRGDPAANLMFHVDPVNRTNLVSPPVEDPLIRDLVSVALSNGPEAGINQPVYGVLMSHIADPTNNGALAGDLDDAQCPDGVQGCEGENRARLSDERFWADCDGDLYPDCRWQKLDALGDLFGLRWVVAARVVDHSALVNINSSLAFNYGDFGPQNVSDGMTPADVDLPRLLRRSAGYIEPPPSSLFDADAQHPDVALAELDARRAVQNHINNGLRLWDTSTVPNGEGFIRNISQGATNQRFRNEVAQFFPNVSQSYTSTDINSLTREQRFAHYRFVGASPQRPRVGGAFAYPQGDEIDLRAYWGFNNMSIVSKFEQALDDVTDNGSGFSRYLFGSTAGSVTGAEADADPYAPEEIGLARSKEITEEVRSYRDQSIAEQANSVGSAGYGQEDRVTRVMRDVRRLVTTVSGVSQRSPVPVLNTTASQFRNRTFLDKLSVADAIDASRGPDREFIRRAFESFVWALAPFATDQPLMHPMTPADTRKIGSEFHYGGQNASVTGVAKGPAKAIEDAGNPDMGASYAILRALALVVNLHDAIDREGSAVGPSPTVAQERPTVVRFFPDNAPDLSSNQWLPDGSVAGALTTSFAQGEINTKNGTAPLPALLPQEYVGDPDAGLTAVGLETQPFLVSAMAYSAYRDEFDYSVGTLGGGNNDPPGVGAEFGGLLRIVTTQINEQLGSIFGVELGNPWPVNINTANYIVRVSDGGTTSPNVIEFALPEATIKAGQSVMFYVAINNDDYQDEWDEIIAGFEGGVGTDDVIRADADDLPIDPVAGGFNMFEPFGTGARLSVQLISDGGATPALVDRLTPPTGAVFPADMSAAIGGTAYPFTVNPSPAPPNEEAWTGRVAYTMFVRRPAAPNGVGGFPGFVVEKPSENIWTETTPADAESTWRVSEMPPSAVDMIVNNVPGELGLANNLDVLSGLPSFQLFVPNGPLFGVSEIGQISAFCHLYRHGAVDSSPPTLTNAHTPPAVQGIAGLASAINQWLTVSEQLGADWHLFYDGTGAPNPYLGVLDLSRFTPGGDLTNPSASPTTRPLPDALAVPMASRVFDAFEGLRPIDDLIQGKININTAPLSVLRLLPLLSPNKDILAGALGGVLPNDATNGRINSNTDRAATIAAYRDARENNGMSPPSPSQFAETGSSGDSRWNNTALEGLRSREDDSRDYAQIPNVLRERGPFAGVQTLGELALLAQWEQADGTSPMADIGSMSDMLPAARDTQSNDQAPLDLREHEIPTFDGADDPEERLALFRAISNIATTRSDVFGAWFILRGYSPERIEALGSVDELPDNPDQEEIMEQLNELEDTGGAVYNKRWFVLFDRSNVKRPTDRPRVLMKVEMPLE